jgi:hypothetical protein
MLHNIKKCIQADPADPKEQPLNRVSLEQTLEKPYYETF